MAQSLRHFLTGTTRLLLFCILVALSMSARAEQIKFDSMKVGSKTYKKVVVLGFNATDVYFTHSKGISNERLKRLDPELQKRFNFDETASANAERQQAADNEEFNKQLVITIEDNGRKAFESKRRNDSTYPESLTDPLTEKSSVGSAMPELKVETWVGEKPDRKEKFQLIYLWAHWSQASRKFLPDVNLLHRKFAKEIAVFGVMGEAAPKVDEDIMALADFPNGIDPGNKFASALLITHVPQVVFADPKGVIRFIGHPAALTEKRVQELIKKFALQ